MAVPSAPNVLIHGHKWCDDTYAQIETLTEDAATSVTVEIRQTQGGAVIETITSSDKSASYPRTESWYVHYPTTGITSTPYYVTVYATNTEGNGTPTEISTYLYFPPTVSVTSPANGSTLTSSAVTMAWTATDTYGISYQRVSVSKGGTELWGSEVEGSSAEVPQTVVFEDGESYSFSVTARNGKGMESTATNTASFHFDVPSSPELSFSEGEGKSATIQVVDPHYSESGATIAVDGSAIADSFTVFGSSVQDGTPTPSAPVAIESVEGNLYDPSTAVAGYLNANGTIAAQTSNNEMTSDFIPVTEGEVITVTLATENHAVNQPWICFIWYKSDQTVGGVFMRYVVSVGMYWKRLIMPAEAAYVRVSARHLASGKANVEVMRGYRWFGSETHDGIDVVTSGRNIADPSATFDYYIGYSSAPYDTANIQNATSLEKSLGFHPVSGGQSVSLSVVGCTSDMTSTSNSGWIRYVMLGADYSLVEFSDRSARSMYSYTTDSFKLNDPIPVPSDARWLAISFRTFGGTPCIRLDGSNEYVPYDGTTTPIDLQGNPLRSLPDGTRDGLKVEGGSKVLVKRVGRVVLTGAWSGAFIVGSTASSSLKMFLLQMAKFTEIFGADAAPRRTGDAITDRGSIYCNLLPRRSTAYNTWTEPSVSGWNDASAAFLFAPDEGLTTSDEFKTWLNAHPLELVYPLATPQEIDLGAVSDHPFIPEDGEMWVDGTEMEAVLRPADYAGQPEPDSIDVVRVNPDGTSWVVASGLDEGDTVTDPLPPLGVGAVYKAIGRIAGAGSSEKTFTYTVESKGWVFNFGDSAHEHVELLYNPETTITLDQGGASYHFADGGAGCGLPVFYPTTDRDMGGTLKFDTTHYGDTDVVLDLCNRYPVAWLRDPYGHRWTARVRPSASHDYGGAWPVTISWNAVRFMEAW